MKGELTMVQSHTKSKALYEIAKQYFPGGVHSPVRAFKSVEGTPLFMKKGEGAYIIDEDDNRYLDFCCSWGPLILGHAPQAVQEQILEVIANGTSFGTPTKWGNLLGKLIVENNRFIEKIRFVSSGTEAVMSAIRLARGATGRSKIVKFEGCYHGHMDALLVKAGSGLATFGESSSAGVPDSFTKETIVLPLDDKNALNAAIEKHGREIACIIIEPIPANNGLLLQDVSFLTYLRKLSQENDILLIFDEVISGFRIDFEGAAGYYDIRPDIITYGKIIGGGMPVGAYAASASLMKNIAPDGAVYQAGTLSANPVAMAAGYATLSSIKQTGFYPALAAKTANMVEVVQNHCDKNSYEVSISHIGSIFWLAFTKQRITRADQIDPKSMNLFKVFYRELLLRGVYLGPSGYEVGFVSAAHTAKDLEKASLAICESLDIIFQKQ